MRCIDADALLYHLADYQLQESPGWGANGHGNADAYEAITNCIKAIENAPTIEPERKKGTWIDRGEEYMLRWVCSECGRKDTHIYNFCPDCGADMR